MGSLEAGRGGDLGRLRLARQGNAGPSLGGVAYAALGSNLAFIALAPALALAVAVWLARRASLDGVTAQDRD